MAVDNYRVPAWGLADVELDEGWQPEKEADNTRTIESTGGLASIPNRLLIRKEQTAGVVNIFSRSGEPVFSLSIDELEDFSEAIRSL